jgi:hypothetical protein
MCANFATLDCIDSNATGYEEGETATTPCYGGPCDTSNAACCSEGECGYIWDEYTASWELDSDTCSFCVSEEDCSVCREDVECGCQEPTYTPSTDQESAQGSCMPIAGTGESSEPIPFRASLSNRTFGLSSKIPQIRNSREEIRNSLALKVTRKGVSKVYLNVKAIKRKRRAMARKVASRRQRMR